MLRKASIALALLAPALLGAQAYAQSNEKKVTLRLSHNLPATNALHTDVLLPWSESIKEASGGSLSIRLFPAQQLGSTKDHYNLARDGIADMALYVLGIEPGRFPVVDAVNIPFLAADGAKGSRAVHEWYQQYASQEMPDVKLCTIMYDAGGTIHSNKPLHSPSDAQGMKIRTANLPTANYFRSAGAVPVQMPATEAAEAAERGMVDGIMFPWSLLKGMGADRALKHHLDTHVYFIGTTLLMNKRSYEKLGEEQKKVIDQHCTVDWSEELSKRWYDSDQKGREALAADPEHTLYKPTDDELNQWKQMTESIRSEWAESVNAKGLDAEEVFRNLQTQLKDHGAAH